MTFPLRLLVVEDSANDAALTIGALTQAGFGVTAERVATADAMAHALEHNQWDLVIADYTMPGFSGLAALALLRKHDAEMPFIFVSGTIGEDAAVGAMKTGAHDYIMKGNLKRLAPAVERELREVDVRRARKRAEERVAHLAFHDALTDLPNRVLLCDRLQQAVLNAQSAWEPLSLIVLDLDGFKAINDSLGHYSGDRALQHVAACLTSVVRDVDTVARLSGDEFALVLPRTDSEGAALVASKILHLLKRPLAIDGHSVTVSGSFGIACLPEHGSNGDVLLQKADIAMYVAKSGGLGFAVYAPDRDRHAHRRLAVMTELRDGVERDQFTCHYQPVVSLKTGLVARVEALARWRHPQRGLLPPSEFIDLAERTGLIDPLMIILLDKALADWTGPNWPLQIPVSVNLSVRNLQDAQIPERIADVLAARRSPPSSLVLEITENFIMADPLRSTRCLRRLHDMGVRLSIDDFGTGYSSLSYLRQLPVDELKIDRSFVLELARGDDAIVRSTIDLAHSLRLTVVAEGVESAAIRDRLRDMGCDLAQGLFFAPPAAAADSRRWVLGRHRASAV